MTTTDKQQSLAAAAFADRWQGGGYEMGIPPAESRTLFHANVAGETPTPQVATANQVVNHCRNYLPHIENQQFQSITFRLYDSVPNEVMQQWKTATDNDQEDADNVEYLRQLIEKYEDAGYGQCFLQDDRVAAVVQNALQYFDGVKYRLICWTVMPNHVHVLLEVLYDCSLSEILHSWRSYSAHEANKLLNRTGQFWMTEYFDRYIRNNDHFRNVVDYIDGNAVKAGLASSPEQWRWSSAATWGAGVSPAETKNVNSVCRGRDTHAPSGNNRGQDAHVPNGNNRGQDAHVPSAKRAPSG